jgi:hypothetical protein
MIENPVCKLPDLESETGENAGADHVRDHDAGGGEERDGPRGPEMSDACALGLDLEVGIVRFKREVGAKVLPRHPVVAKAGVRSRTLSELRLSTSGQAERLTYNAHGVKASLVATTLASASFRLFYT